jgi:hypothetical protein
MQFAPTERRGGTSVTSTPQRRASSGSLTNVLELQRLAGNGAVAHAQRDLAVSSDDRGATSPLIDSALAALVHDKKVTQVRDGGLTMWGSTEYGARASVVTALQAKGFAEPAKMADAVFDRDNVVLFDGTSPEDALSRQKDRPLTGAERHVAKMVFGDTLDLDPVTVSESRVIAAFGYARTLPNHIYFPNDSFANLSLSWLIHELTHVWQYQHGASIPNMVVCAIRGHYEYGGEAGLRKAWAAGDNFADFGTEQQGDILAHYYERLVSGDDTSAFDAFVAQVRVGAVDVRLPEPEPVTPLPGGTLDVKALNERHRARVEADIVRQLRVNPTGKQAMAARRDRVVELFGELAGYWSATYRDRIATRASRDELVTLLYTRMTATTVAKIGAVLAGSR